jgi:hypothetical protein
VFADAIQRTGANPQDQPAEIVRVALDLGVEEVDGGALGPQTLPCICAIVPAEATTRAPNRSANSPAANQWSPWWPWVMKMSVRFRPLAATQSPRMRA